MAKLKLFYDGWLALPSKFRQALHLDTGTELEAELVGDTVVLRSAPGKTAKATVQLPAAAPTPPTSRTARKTTSFAVLPTTLKTRGRRPRREGEPGLPPAE